MTFAELLATVPDVIWSGIIGAVLALMGVMLVNWSNTTRLKLQLAHDSDEKVRQRKAELRKDVYLTVVEEMVKASSHLGALPQANLSNDMMMPVQGFFAAAAKLQIVAETETAVLVGDLVSTYGELMFNVMGHAAPVQAARADADRDQKFYDKCQNEIARVLAAMKQHSESGSVDNEAFKRLNRSYEFATAQAEKYTLQQKEHLRQANFHQLSFLRALVPQMKTIGLKTMSVTVQIRRELELDTNQEALSAQFKTQWQRMDAVMENLFKSLERV